MVVGGLVGMVLEISFIFVSRSLAIFEFSLFSIVIEYLQLGRQVGPLRHGVLIGGNVLVNIYHGHQGIFLRPLGMITVDFFQSFFNNRNIHLHCQFVAFGARPLVVPDPRDLPLRNCELNLPALACSSVVHNVPAVALVVLFIDVLVMRSVLVFPSFIKKLSARYLLCRTLSRMGSGDILAARCVVFSPFLGCFALALPAYPLSVSQPPVFSSEVYCWLTPGAQLARLSGKMIRAGLL